MLKITFPDGKQKEYESGVTGFDIAADISLSLSKVAIAILVNGHQKDLADSEKEPRRGKRHRRCYRPTPPQS